MIDAGRAATQRAIDAGLQLADLVAVFVTHHHSDHLSDLPTEAITRWVAGATDPLKVIAPQGASSRFAGRCLDAFDDDCFHAQADAGVPSRPSIVVHDFVASNDLVSVWAHAGWQISSVLVDHHPVAPAVGYRVHVDDVSVAVSGDTAVCDGMRTLAHCVDMLVHETVLTAAASAEMLAWNAGAVSVGALARAAQVRTLVMTHLLPAPAAPRHEQKYIDEVRSGGWHGPVHVAHDLLRLTIGV
jgi:ribonuclease Z